MSCKSTTIQLRCSPGADDSADSRTPVLNDPPRLLAPWDGYIVYGLEELTSGRHYVGLTRRSLTERLASHLSQARRDRPIRPQGLMAALRLMDALGQRFQDCFSARILATADTADQARALERHWIDRLECRSPCGLNAMPGGSSIGGLDNAKALSVTREDGEAWTFPSIRHAIDVCNADRAMSGQPRLEYSAVYARLASGWSPEEALGVTPRRFPGSVRRNLAMGDAVYGTLYEASAATGVLPATLRSRLHRLSKAGLPNDAQIGKDRRARGRGRVARLEFPWPGTQDRLTAAEFAARSGVPKATAMHRWHRARPLCADGQLSPEALHAFLTMPPGSRRTAADALARLLSPTQRSAEPSPGDDQDRANQAAG